MAFESLSEKLQNVFKNLRGKGRLSEDDVRIGLKEVRLALLEADVSFKVVKDFIKSIQEKATGSDVLNSLTPAQQVIKIVNDEMVSLMGSETTELKIKPSGEITVIMMAGLQGAGKTTTTAKLAAKLKKKGNSPLLVGCDIYRPAAIEQLKRNGEKVDVPVFEMGTNHKPVEIAKKAIEYAKENRHNIVFIDTAGRLHIDEDMMDELIEIKDNVNVDDIILVVDAMTGQDAVNVAETFNAKLDITGVILTKLDGDTRGGAALSLKTITGKPIFYIGTGEKLEDLEPFYPDRIASRILGMGDIVSLVEKAQALYDEEEAEKLQKKMQSESFSLADMLMQLEQAEKMGPLESMLDMIPGLSGQIDKDKLDLSLLKRQKAIIQSMTLKERDNFRIIGPPRRKRIAKGSGTSVGDVNKLLKQFEKTRQMMRKVSKNKGLQAKMMSGGLFG